MTFAVQVDLSYNRENYLIFCGTARSGTTYISKVCQALGLDVQHEKYGEDGIAAFQLAPFLYLFDRAAIYHQVREPLACISSCQTISKKVWMNISEYLPIINEFAELYRDRELYIHNCMMYYYYWNTLIAQKRFILRHQVETVSIDTCCVLCNITGITPAKISLPAISQTTNTRADRYDMLSWPMLQDIDSELCDKIKEMGANYGYDCP